MEFHCQTLYYDESINKISVPVVNLVTTNTRILTLLFTAIRCRRFATEARQCLW